MPSTEAGGTLITWLETLFAVPAFRRLVHAPAVGCKRAGIRACMLLAALSPAMAQAQLPPSPFPTTRSVAWDGEIMDNIVLRYRRVLFYPQAAERLMQALQGFMDETLLRRVCTFSPEWTEVLRRSSGEYEKTIHLSGFNKREEIREVRLSRSDDRDERGCPEPPLVLQQHKIEISTPAQTIKFSRVGDQSRVQVRNIPPVIRDMRITRAQSRLRDARNPGTRIGRSMGRVWAEEATFNGFRCGSNFGVNGLCTFLDQPRHVGTDTSILVRISTEVDPRCEQDPTDDETRTLAFLIGCVFLGAWELIEVQQNARIPQDLFEMPPEARGLPVNQVTNPEPGEDRDRD